MKCKCGDELIKLDGFLDSYACNKCGRLYKEAYGVLVEVADEV